MPGTSFNVVDTRCPPSCQCGGKTAMAIRDSHGGVLTVHDFPSEGFDFGLVISDADNETAAIGLTVDGRRALAKALLEGLD